MLPINLRMEICHWQEIDIDRRYAATSLIIGQPPLHTNYDYQNEIPFPPRLSNNNAAGRLQIA